MPIQEKFTTFKVKEKNLRKENDLHTEGDRKRFRLEKDEAEAWRLSVHQNGDQVQ